MPNDCLSGVPLAVKPQHLLVVAELGWHLGVDDGVRRPVAGGEDVDVHVEAPRDAIPHDRLNSEAALGGHSNAITRLGSLLWLQNVA